MAATKTFLGVSECIDPYAKKRYMMMQNRNQYYYHHPGYPFQTNFPTPPRQRPAMQQYFQPYKLVNYADRKINKPYRRRSHLNDIFGINTENGRFNKFGKPGKRPFNRNNSSVNFSEDVSVESDVYTESSSNGGSEHGGEYFPNNIQIVPKKRIQLNLKQQQPSNINHDNNSPNKSELICESIDVDDDSSSVGVTGISRSHELVTNNVIDLCSPEREDNIEIPSLAIVEEETKKTSIPFLENSNSEDTENTILEDIGCIADLNGNCTSIRTECIQNKNDKEENEPVQDVDTSKRNSPDHESNLRLRNLFGDEDFDEQSTSSTTKIESESKNKTKKLRVNSTDEFQEKNKNHVNKTKYKIPRLKNGLKESASKNNAIESSSRKVEQNAGKRWKRIRSNVDIDSKRSCVDTQPQQSETKVCKDVENGTKPLTSEYKVKKSYSEIQIQELKKNTQHKPHTAESKTEDVQPQVSKNKISRNKGSDKKRKHKTNELKRSHSSVQISESDKHDFKHSDKDKKEKVQLGKLKIQQSREAQKVDCEEHQIKKVRLEVHIQKLDSQIVKDLEKGKKLNISEVKLVDDNCQESKRFCKDVANGAKQKNDDNKLKKPHSEVRIQESDKQSSKDSEKDQKQKSTETELNGAQPNVTEKIVCKNVENATKQKNGENKVKKSNSSLNIHESDKKACKDLEKSNKRRISENETSITQCQASKKKDSKDVSKHLQQAEKYDDHIDKHRGHSKHKSLSSSKDNSEMQLHGSSLTPQIADKTKHNLDRAEKSVNSPSQVLKHRASTESEEEKSTKKTSSKVSSNHLKDKASNKNSSKKDSEVISKRRSSDESKSHKHESKKYSSRNKNENHAKLTSKDAKQKLENLSRKNENQVKLSPKDSREESLNLTKTIQDKDENQIKLTPKDTLGDLEYSVKTNQIKNDSQVKLTPKDIIEELEDLLKKNENKNEGQIKLTPKDSVEKRENLLKNNENKDENQIKLTQKDSMVNHENFRLETNQNKNESNGKLTPNGTIEDPHNLLKILDPENHLPPSNGIITLYRSEETVDNLLELQATSATILPSDAKQVELKRETANCETMSPFKKEADISQNTNRNLSAENTEFSNDTSQEHSTISKIMADIFDDLPNANTTSSPNITIYTNTPIVTSATCVLGGTSCTNAAQVSNITTNASPSIIGNVTSNVSTNTNLPIIANVTGITDSTNVTQISSITSNMSHTVNVNATRNFNDTSCTDAIQNPNHSKPANMLSLHNMPRTISEGTYVTNKSQDSTSATDLKAALNSNISRKTNLPINANAIGTMDSTCCVNASPISYMTSNMNHSITTNTTRNCNGTSYANAIQTPDHSTLANILYLQSILQKCTKDTPIRNQSQDSTSALDLIATQISNISRNANLPSSANATGTMDSTCSANVTQFSNVTSNTNHSVTRNFNGTSYTYAHQIPNHSKTLMSSLEQMPRTISKDASITNQPQDSSAAKKVSNIKPNEFAPVFPSPPMKNGMSNMSNNEENCVMQPSAGSLRSPTATSMYEPISPAQNYAFNMGSTKGRAVVELAATSPPVPTPTLHPILPVDNSTLRQNAVDPTKQRNMITLKDLSELMEHPRKSTSNDSDRSNSLSLGAQAENIIITNIWLYLIVRWMKNSFGSLTTILNEYTPYLPARLDEEQIAFNNYQTYRIKKICNGMMEDLSKLKWEQGIYDYGEILKSVVKKIHEKCPKFTELSLWKAMGSLFDSVGDKYSNNPHFKDMYNIFTNNISTSPQVTTPGQLSPQQRDLLRNQIMCFNHLTTQNRQPSIANGSTRVANTIGGFPKVTMVPTNTTTSCPNVTITRAPLNVTTYGPTYVTGGPPNVTINPPKVTTNPSTISNNSLNSTHSRPSSLVMKQSVMNRPPPYPHTTMHSNFNERNGMISNSNKSSTASNSGTCNALRGNFVEGTEITGSHLKKLLATPSLVTNTVGNVGTVLNTVQNGSMYPIQGNSSIIPNNTSALQTASVHPVEDLSGFCTNFQTHLPFIAFQNQQVSAIPTNAAIHNTPPVNFNVNTLQTSPPQSSPANNICSAINNDANAMNCQSIDKRKTYSVVSAPICFSISMPSTVITTANTSNATTVRAYNQTGVTNNIPADITQPLPSVHMPRNENTVKSTTPNSNNQASSPIPQNVASPIAPANQVGTDDAIGPIASKSPINGKTDSAVSRNDPVNSTVSQVSTTISTGDPIVMNTSISIDAVEHLTIENPEEDTIEIKCEYQADGMILNKDVPEIASPVNRGVSNDDTDANLQKYITMLIKAERTCVCKKPAEYVCSCKAAIYCSEECQKAEWNNHKRVCGSVFSKK